MIQIIRTNSTNADFQKLVQALDTYLAVIDGDEHAFYAQFNKTNFLNQVVLAYEDDVAVGCGAVKLSDTGEMEIKRMYTNPSVRGKGIATAVLGELEKWIMELGFSKCVLETGNRQLEAIALYKKNDFNIIPNFGPYQGVENSVCFQKNLKEN